MKDHDPIQQLSDWIEEVRNGGTILADAMALATADADGTPDARMVMVRKIDAQGLVFYTDRTSAKGNQLRLNQRAALLSYWRELGRQVRIYGSVERTTPTEDEEAFTVRPRQEQLAIAAWRQGDVIESQEQLVVSYHKAEKRFQGRAVTRPTRWGGYILIPSRFVFWQDSANKIHHRQEYTRGTNGIWHQSILTP